MTYEYLVEANIHVRLTVDRLNGLGKDGWELCAVLPESDGLTLIYKRAIPQHV
ncbi:MAG: hypothetical protein WDO18_23310 [Acidobacteriota bacterium]